MSDKVVKTEAEWRALLTPMQYHVTRQAGTERAFTGALYDTKTKGTYFCICCDHKLFESSMKFDSGCGWPSFYEEDPDANIDKRRDTKFGMVRTEVVCSMCEAHLGHVFPDGPPPTGLRYCINSASLRFEPSE